MGIISRDGYDRKREYAARKMEENRLIETLNEEQHDVLSWLCSLRHEMHTNQHSLFLNESAEFSLWKDYELIYSKLTACGLPEIKLIDSASIPCDADSEFDEDFNYDEAYEEYMGIIEDINNKIETYLRTIDKEYGTDYCPTGKSRA